LALLGVLSALGLAAGLLEEGWWDWACVAMLAVPLLVAAWHALHPVVRARARRRRP
jgi:hypothetical protein